MLAGAVFLLVSAVVRQARAVLVARTIIGLVVAALIVRRIVDPPSLDYDVTPRLGIYLGALGALMAAAGGLVDSGREVVEQRPDLAVQPGPASELPTASDDARERGRARRATGPSGDVVDSTAREI